MEKSKFIPYGRQDITEEDIEAVVKVLRSSFLTQGPTVPQFEKKVSQYCGVGYGVATNSATSALHIACLALGLSKGDYMWTSPITFVASANCGLYCGAKVDFVDINPKTYNMSPQALEEKLVQAEKEGRLPKIVIPVHFSGQSCDMHKIYNLSKKYGFKIIEDASHAIGGRYKKQLIGNCKYSNITIFSFHPVKIITTGEGGIALTNSSKLAKKMLLFRSHGITHDPKLMTYHPDGEWYYQQIDLGYNYRMTDIQAALGASQIHRLNKYIKKRKIISERYDYAFNSLPIVTPYRHPDSEPSYHLYVILVDEHSRKDVFNKLRDQGVGVNVHYIPVHMQPYFLNIRCNSSNYKNAEYYYKRAISLPMYPTLLNEEQDKVINLVKDFFRS